MIVIFITFVLMVLASLVFYMVSRAASRKQVSDELQLRLFSVRIMKQLPGKLDVKQEISISDQLLGALASFNQPFIFEAAVSYIGEDIHFYVAAPGSVSDAVVRQIQALWNDASVEPVEDYNIFNYSGVTVGAWVRQKDNFSMPIRTFTEMNADTFLPILGGLAKVNEIGEGGAIQVVVRPAPKRKKEIEEKVRELKKGTKENRATIVPSVSEIMTAATGGLPKDEKKPEERIVNESGVRALESKLSKPLFEVNVRILASAPVQSQADSLLDGMAAGFSQFSAPDRNELKVMRPRNFTDLIHSFSFRSFVPDQAMVVTSEEIASFFHFPTSMTDIPKIKYLSFREAPPPSILPKDGIVLGESVYRGVRKPVHVLKEDRRRHLYVIGQTGTGKSVLLNSLSGQDIVSGEGVCIIDPNGDLFNDVLGRVPKNRVEDLVVLDPSDMSRPLGLNMLEYDPLFPEQKTFIVNELLNIFNTLYDMKTAGGPMFEQYMRNTLLLLMDDPADAFTLIEVPRVLADPLFRKKLLAKCRNVIVKDFWEKEAEKAGGEASLQNMVPYITSKFNTFIANDYVRPIIAQPKSSLNFRSILDTGKILLVNLSKGRIGDLNASLLGMIVVGKLTLAAFSRANVSENERRDFYLYIDEFQNFTTPSISTILSEARKYRLCLTMAHQFIGQLSGDIKNAVFGNVGSMVVFRVGADDAEFLAKQFEPVFTQADIINIDNLNAHVKLIVNNQITTPFNIFVPFPPRGNPELAQLGKEYSRLTYGRNREDVETDTYKRLRS